VPTPERGAKVRYRGLEKNATRLFVACGLINLYDDDCCEQRREGAPEFRHWSRKSGSTAKIGPKLFRAARISEFVNSVITHSPKYSYQQQLIRPSLGLQPLQQLFPDYRQVLGRGWQSLSV